MTPAMVPKSPVVHRVLTDDLDEASEFIRRNFGDHSRVPHGRGRLGLEMLASVAAGSAAGAVRLGIPTTLRASARGVAVHLPLGDGGEYRIGRRRLVASPDVAVVLAPGHDYTVLTPGRVTTLAIMLDRSVLSSELDARLPGRTARVRADSIELPLSPVERVRFRALIAQHLSAAGPGPEARRREDMEGVERALASWLADRLVHASGLVALSPSGLAVAERVEGWIRGHVERPISLEQLSARAGVSRRMLQKACRARWGQTPLELVLSRRLDAVRARLTGHRPPRTVTEAAVRGGFTHLGRFSKLYRQAFGESPSETLAGRRDHALHVTSTPPSTSTATATATAGRPAMPS